MNAQNLFAKLRTFSGPLSQPQVDSVNAILSACDFHGVTDPRQIAYILATAYHEARFKPIEEIGKGAGLPYGQKLDIGKGPGKRVPYIMPDQVYYGRGLVQLTWKTNYAIFSKILGVDLINNPALALDTTCAANIIVAGMQNGLFTGVGLDHFFFGSKCDPVDARTIVNGHNCAVLIAGYYSTIYSGII